MGQDDASQHGANEGHSCRPHSSPGGEKVSEPLNMHCTLTARATDNKRGAERHRRGRKYIQREKMGRRFKCMDTVGIFFQ